MTNEFSLIAKYFAPLSPQSGDDCALLSLNDNEQLAISVDTLVQNVHFYADAPPDQVGYRAVVTALSDLAAMGAQPRAITLALTLPEANHSWLREFSRGIEQATLAYEVELLGGDTTKGPLTISVTVMGAVPQGEALTRCGARPGDKVYVTGPTGDAAAALTVMNGEWPGQRQHKEYLLNRFYRPTARTDLGQQLRGIASSAIDISDGLLADAQHLCQRSHVSISINSQQLPLSAALLSVPDDAQAKRWALTGGDDYELLFTVAAENTDRVPDHCVCIGQVLEDEGGHATVQCDFSVQDAGYQHFDDS